VPPSRAHGAFPCGRSRTLYGAAPKHPTAEPVKVEALSPTLTGLPARRGLHLVVCSEPRMPGDSEPAREGD
jgi:hypothetical protein